MQEDVCVDTVGQGLDRVLTTSALPRRRDARLNRGYILESAIRTLHDDRDATYEKIIADSGLSRSTVFRHFPSRQTLIRSVVAQLLNEARRRFECARPAEPPFAAALARMTNAALCIDSGTWNLIARAGGDSLTHAMIISDIEVTVRDLMHLGIDEGTLCDNVAVEWCMDVYFTIVACTVRDAGSSSEDAGDLVCDLFLNGCRTRKSP